MKKRILWTALVLLLCGLSVTLFYFNNQKSIYFKPIVDPVTSIDPSQTRFRLDYSVARAIFGELLRVDEYGNIRPSLIQSWHVLDNATRYVFKITSGIKFHDGKFATAEDVSFTIHYLARKDSLMNHQFNNILGFSEYQEQKVDHLRGVKVLDPYTLEIQLRKPSHIFLKNLADPKIAVLPKGLRGKSVDHFFQNPIGIGPYRLDEFVLGSKELKLKAFKKYHHGAPAISEFRLSVLGLDEALHAYKKGKVHDLEMYSLSDAQVKSLVEKSKVFSVFAYATSLFFVNGESPLMQSEKTRKFISSQIDREQLSQNCEVTVDPLFSLLPRGVMGWRDVKKLHFKKVSKIKKLKKLRVLSYGHENNRCILNDLVRQLELKVANKVVVKHVKNSEIVKEFQEGDYDLFFEHISVRTAEPYHLFAFFDPSSPHNLTKFSDQKISLHLDKIRSTAVRDYRGREYRKLSDYITIEKQYVIPLFSDIRKYVFSRKVKSKKIPSTVMMNTSFADLKL